MKKYGNSKKLNGVIKKFVKGYIEGMSKYLFPDQYENKKGKEKESPKFKNDKDRIFFK